MPRRNAASASGVCADAIPTENNTSRSAVRMEKFTDKIVSFRAPAAACCRHVIIRTNSSARRGYHVSVVREFEGKLTSAEFSPLINVTVRASPVLVSTITVSPLGFTIATCINSLASLCVATLTAFRRTCCEK